MKKSFKVDDRVSFGVVPGSILGIYNVNKALFFSDYPKSNFLTFAELREVNKADNPTFFFFIREKFGVNKLSERAKLTLKQRRFLPVLLTDLKHLPAEQKSELESMINKRHLYLTMARHYVRSKESDEKVHRVCEKIEELQFKIENL